MSKEIEKAYFKVTKWEELQMCLSRFKEAVNELGVNDYFKIKKCTARMLELQKLMIEDKNFRLLYERSFERYFKIRKSLIKKLTEI